MTATGVLVSSAGRRVGLVDGFRAALRTLDLDGVVVAADQSSLAAAFHRADASVLVPPCSSPEFVPALLEACARHHVGVVVPTIDTELPVLAAASRVFADAGVTVAISSSDIVEIGADKRRTHEWLTAEGLPRPEQWESHVALDRAWRGAVVVKPARGSASKGVVIVEDPAAIRDSLRARSDVIVQELVPGVEHTIDLFISRSGALVCAVPRRRLEVRAGEVSKAQTVRSPELLDLAARAAGALPGAFGALNLQVVENAAGQHLVIELNPRFGGGFPLSLQAGADFPRWLLEEHLGLPSTANDAWTDGLVMLRYDDAVFIQSDQRGPDR